MLVPTGSFATLRSLVPAVACALAFSAALGCEEKKAAEPAAAAPAAPAQIAAPAATAPAASAPAATAPAASPPPASDDGKDPCKLASASAASVSQLLGIGALSGPKSSQDGSTTRCAYGGAESITIAISTNATSKDLDSMRKSIEMYPPGAMKPYPGFGDKALSREIEMPVAGKKLKINSLAVLKGKTLVYVASKAPLEKIRGLETALLKDLAAL
jgi:hypothetical protein